MASPQEPPAQDGPPKELLDRYRRIMEKEKKAHKRIPNEDFARLKADLIELRRLAEAAAAETGGTVPEGAIAKWQEAYPDLALRRPTLFNMVVNPQKDLTMALGMVDILQGQRDSRNYDIEDANHKLVTYLCDQTGFQQGKEWLAQAEKERKTSRRATK